jgi:L-alanine-DL-glutamate epimerase-like enolase superfamily enzyme
LVDDVLAPVVCGRDPLDVPACWEAMVRQVRNVGRPGIASMAIAAVDLALWDLKACLLELPLCELLGRAHDVVEVYGSGGFTSMDEGALCAQLAGWVADGIRRVKMKVGTAWGTDETADLRRATRVREAIGADADLFVDANGGYQRKQAIRLEPAFRELGVTWFEEPVSSDDLAGLHEVRAVAGCDIAAGEYGYSLAYFRHLCDAGAVDVVQADITRCAGPTEWRRIAALAAAHGLEISGHCAPALHLHAALATINVRHLEWFADHVRIEATLFDGARAPQDGVLHPDLSRPGMGLALKERDAEPYRIA